MMGTTFGRLDINVVWIKWNVSKRKTGTSGHCTYERFFLKCNSQHTNDLTLLDDDSPFPAAFDEAKSREDVLDAAGGFIVECE